MRVVDEDNYIPKLVSIGPLHRKNPLLHAMETHKLRCLHQLLNRIGSSLNEHQHQPGTMSLDSLKRDMKEFEKQTRECYFEDYDNMTSDEFVEMMVIDGCFVVELLRSATEYFNKLDTITGFYHQDSADPIFSTRFMLPQLGLDLLLFENQLPLFVLQKLYDLTASNQVETPFNDLAIAFLMTLVPGRKPNYYDADKDYEHLLALFQSICIRPKNYHPKHYHGKWLGSAIELMCAGIKFEKGEGHVRKILKIPPLFLDNLTPQILRNAVAYEQCNTSAEPYFSSLVVFFDFLVDSAQEVKYLRRNGIINQFGGSDDLAAEDLNKLSKGVLIRSDECYISEVVDKIKIFTKSRWAVWRGTMYLYYFLDQQPLNLLLFYFTIIQTISSLYQIIFDSTKSENS